MVEAEAVAADLAVACAAAAVRALHLALKHDSSLALRIDASFGLREDVFTNTREGAEPVDGALMRSITCCKRCCRAVSSV